MSRQQPRPFAMMFAILVTLGCGHSDSFTGESASAAGPFVDGSDVHLTFNVEQDYWPSWTEDSSAVLYAFVPPGRADHDRCVGLIRAEGSTRIWQMCDDRATHADSSDSFTGVALGHDGRLLYEELSARINKEAPDTRALWLADSAHPFNGRKLIDFPILVSGSSVDWLLQTAWTGPDDFIALAAEYVPVAHCKACAADDSAFVGKFVVRGHIGATAATLTRIPGTDGASSFALGEAGNSVLFALRTGTQIFGVSASGGTAVMLGSAGNQNAITGIACRVTTCVVATDLITVVPPGSFPILTTPSGSLYRFNITTGAATLLRNNPLASNAAMFASPLLHPNGKDIVVQAGGIPGNLQTASSSLGDLYLFKGILP